MSVDFVKSEKDGVTFVKPEKCRTFCPVADDSYYENSDYIVELKQNGWRLETSRSNTLSRNLKSKHVGFLRDVLPKGYLLDGELVSTDPGMGFSDVAHLIVAEPDRLKYVVFDILFDDGKDVMDKPWHERRRLLENVMADIDCSRVELNEVIYDGKRDFVKFVEENGWEGIVFKYINGAYSPDARRNWIKWKMTDEWDAVIVDANGKPTGEGPIAKGHVILRYGFYDLKTHELRAVGGTGLSMPPAEAMKKIGQVVCIKGYGINPTGAIIHPHVEYFRDDKGPNECVFDFANGKYIELEGKAKKGDD